MQDLLFAQHGVGRGLAGEYPSSYDDPAAPFTPAWQEQYTGVDRAQVVRLAREWADTAERTGGRCSVIIGAGVNHWYHADLAYRAALTTLMLCGCVGKNGGGPQPLRRPGEARADRAVGLHRGRARLGEAAAVPERAVVPLRPLRPVAL